MLWKKWVGIGLVGLSGLWFAGLFLVPISGLPLETIAVLEVLFLAMMEASFWLGSILIGKQVLSRYWQPIKDRIGLGRRGRKSEGPLSEGTGGRS